jgi:hypothetical protein
MDSILFSDVEVGQKPSAVDSELYKSDGVLAGEAIIKQVLDNGKYRIAMHGNRLFDARAVFSMGENVLPTGIPVMAMAYNGDAWILGRLRATKDEDSSDGETDTDRSTTIGTPGDAQLRPHVTDDDKISAEVTVTTGGVTKVKASSATNMTLHPIGERIIQRCQSLLAFSDGYRIESGRKTGKAGSVSMGALTSESYKTKVGPARTEVRVKNGKVSGSTVHQLSVETLSTTGGKTLGTADFKWTVSSSGTWQVKNCKAVKFGQLADEPVVLGNKLVLLLKALITDMTTVRTGLTALATAMAAANQTLAAALLPPLFLIPPLVGLAVFVLAQAQAIANTTMGGVMGSSIAGLTITQTSYLTPLGISKELILSDFVSTQKIAPIPGVVSE